MDEGKKNIIFSLIGIVIMLLGFPLPGIGLISSLGMTILCIFIGALFLWSTVGGVWASLLALFLIGLSGLNGEGGAGFLATLTGGIGERTVLTVLFMFILFGALQMSGGIPYVVRWVMTRKWIIGRPYLILTAITLVSYALSFVTDPVPALMVMWSIVASICSVVGLVHGKDQVWKYLFGGVFLGVAIGQPGMPVKGVGIAMMQVFTNVSGGEYPIDNISYMLYNLILSIILIAIFVLLVRFVFRPDVSKLKALSREDIYNAGNLPPISQQQKCYLWMLLLFLLMVLLPSIPGLANVPGLNVLNMIGAVGVCIFWIILFSLVRVEGRPLLEFQKVASAQRMMWQIVLMVSVATMIGSAMGSSELGIIDALKSVLNPILSGKPELLVVFIIYLAAMLMTNVANNAAMSMALTPVIVAVAGQMGLNPAPIALGVMMLVFVALLLPAASPASALCHGETSYYTSKEIRSWGLVISALAVLLHTFVGYPLACMMLERV